jgi:hypothetical protein
LVAADEATNDVTRRLEEAEAVLQALVALAERLVDCHFTAPQSLEQYGHWRGFHPDGRLYQAEEWPISRAIRKGETVVHQEIELERGDGTRGAISVSASPIRDHTGQIVAGMVTMDYITERQRAAQAAGVRTRQQAALAALGQQALSEQDITVLMNRAVALASETLGVEMSNPLELAPDGRTFTVRAVTGWEEDVIKHAITATGSSRSATSRRNLN